jgi:hypothetical protein
VTVPIEAIDEKPVPLATDTGRASLFSGIC